ncbi:MAG: MMPL family transporter [Micrococcales bacterium]|nr:MMPL family transporter [Micrococcales bacterium]
MATYLYKLGRWCARHAWATVLAWVLVLGLLAGSAGALMKPFTSEMKIPGAPFQTVLDDLRTEIPAAAGGVGTVVFTTTDGTRFTDEQKAAITTVLGEWKKVDGVETTVDPFAMQKQIDEGAAKLAAGQRQLADGEAKLAPAKTKIEEGQSQLAFGKRALADLKKQAGAAPAGSPQRAQLDAQVAALQKQITEGEARLNAGKAQYEAGRAQLDAAKATTETGARKAALSEGMRFVSKEGSVAQSQVIFADAINNVPLEIRQAIPEAGKSLSAKGVEVNYSSELVRDVAGIMGPGEILGLAMAALVLLVMLGSLVAAGLPLLNAVIGVAVGVLATVALTHWVQMNDITPALAVMLGLAVGIDYTLFLVNRHREQLARGVPLEESIARANGTAGSAVLFAGMTVFVALAALFVTGMPFLTILGLSAAGTVAVAVLVALTLTPALLHIMGSRVLSARSRRRLREELEREDEMAAEAARTHHEPPATGWGGLVTTHPHVVMAIVTGLLVLLAIPAASLRLGLPDGGTDSSDSTGYKTYSTIADSFGAGANGPIVAVGKVAQPKDAAATDALSLRLGERLKETAGVEFVLPIGASSDQDTIAYQIVPTTGPGEEATVDLVGNLRAMAPSIERDTGVDVGFTGQTVANIDISDRLGDALPIYLAVVVGISLLLLLLVFRSIVVPLLATGGFLLSVAAAFGAVVAVYQWGWLGSLFAVEHPSSILSFLPTLVIGVLFGLAMDYQMFLVTGMREAWAHGQDAHTAVRTGFSHGARVVTAAALIMASVFAGFIHADMTMIRPIGFALAIGVLIDAFLVRMTATPAVMHLLGEKAWYLPRWLDRILPDLDVEGTKLAAARDEDRAREAEVTDDALAEAESHRPRHAES